METQDLELVRSLVDKDEELARLWAEHLEFEKVLEEMNQRPYLSPQEQLERKHIQKKKLAGRDRIEAILAKHR